MIKIILLIIAALFSLGFTAYIIMAMLSQKTPETLGLEQGLLLPCPTSPNCVCSEVHAQDDKIHFVSPIPATEKSWVKLRQNIIDLGGNIQSDKSDYLHATFSSPIFRYVDDLELRLDRANNLIHMRSASRIGRSDFGVNRKRVESLKQSL